MSDVEFRRRAHALLAVATVRGPYPPHPVDPRAVHVASCVECELATLLAAGPAGPPAPHVALGVDAKGHLSTITVPVSELECGCGVETATRIILRPCEGHRWAKGRVAL